MPIKNKPSLTHLPRPNDVQTSAFAHYPVAASYFRKIVKDKVKKVKKKKQAHSERDALAAGWRDNQVVPRVMAFEAM